jgi:hypothetical protein
MREVRSAGSKEGHVLPGIGAQQGSRLIAAGPRSLSLSANTDLGHRLNRWLEIQPFGAIAPIG